jgi:Glycosyl hydrolases family 2, TIM barrel domain
MRHFSSLRNLKRRPGFGGPALVAVAILAGLPSGAAQAAAIPVKVVKTAAGWRLLRGGEPYFIKGAAGDGPKDELARAGGNSIRTWGVDGDTPRVLDEARRLGLTVTLGIWLGHKEHGFNYRDAASVRRQLDEARKTVLRYKDHPALLLWGLGNEMEMGDDSPELWAAIDELARMVHEVDPRHPVMTVVAEIGGGKLETLERRCPSVDIIGINSYGGGPSLLERYRRAGGSRPYVITEYGPPGTWEIGRNAFGAVRELTSTEKARSYRAIYEKSVLAGRDLCLGSYAFAWGHKIEATATWYGLFLADGGRLAGIDVLTELWSGRPPAHRCPEMRSLSIQGLDQVAGGAVVRASVDAAAALAGEPLTFHWSLQLEQADYGVQGVGARPTASFPDAIERDGGSQVAVRMPAGGGTYRLYCVVRDRHGGAAVGSVPVLVKGPAARFSAPAAALPLVIAAGGKSGPYSPSGWMGEISSIAMENRSGGHLPGQTGSLEVAFKGTRGWGGVVWQDPPNDWGTRPGGYDLSRATRLAFWARGARGGEHVTFGYGLIGIDKRFHDSALDRLEITLGREWQRYVIELAGRDLSCIKTGFLWTVQAQPEPLTFFLDDVRYE